ncbi:MAG: fumarate hydratase [Candidatus Marinimicrobia bacterium]|nr:fumarate hydratase [Candidatus Neomarinimicrobiota bacterium]MCF7850323.1 fumarate hydratase [Candidatus Neomarinimicrobiota bacterium]MCF7903915.1 fumarate hydratase [Candidatus Neomarinimicrobiota bacterium]
MFQYDDKKLKDQLLELIRRAATDLPEDVVDSMRAAWKNEPEGSSARSVFGMLLKNIELAKAESIPMCQDTGTNIYLVYIPEGFSMRKLTALIHEATEEAVEKSYLRPNAVDSITGKNSGNNLGEGQPFIHFEEWDEDYIEFKIMLKGGGCENVSTQYKLPDVDLGADRDMDGVYKVIVDAVNEAQGQGCAPGILGIGIGGDRASSSLAAKIQLYRKLPDTNENAEMAKMESKLLADLNELGVGPMGFGGKTTILGVKIGSLHRLPASFFVSISYMCWAYRRRSMTLNAKGEVTYD